jgi:ribosomal protein L37AE/L43A
MPLHFTQSCPTCGRRVQVHTRLLGQKVACQHCHAEFVASAADDAQSWGDSSYNLLARVDEALKRSQPKVTSPI